MGDVILRLPPALERRVRKLGESGRARVESTAMELLMRSVARAERIKRLRERADVADAIAFLDEIDRRQRRRAAAQRRRKR